MDESAVADVNSWIQTITQFGLAGGLLAWLVMKYLPKLNDQYTRAQTASATQHNESLKMITDKHAETMQSQHAMCAAELKSQRIDFKETVDRVCQAHEKTVDRVCTELRDEMKTEREQVVAMLAGVRQGGGA